MRRLGWTVFCILLIAGLAAPAGSAAQDGRIVAVVLKVNNDVRQRPAAASDWEPARRGQPLLAGHELRTGEDSFCALIFQDDQSLLKITSNTEVTLNVEEAGGGKFSKKVWVGVGGIWAKVTKQEDTAFEIETPTSVASVKGSSCYDMIGLSGWTTLFVENGSFQFSNPFGQVDVPPGFKGFSNGVDPPGLTKTGPGETPTFGQEGPGGGFDQGRGDESAGELRLGMQGEDGTQRTLIIRYKESE